mmetsp:Transcript_83472/g.269959  ORF Transcript_83472/g.269959 Transcript_83472/m.269959 type:complete len:267 (+) Transcript_83472:58-858(+)
MCGHLQLLTNHARPASAEKAGQLAVQVVNALSGEVLLPLVTAAEDWNIRRLKFAVVRLLGSDSADVHLLLGDRLLTDAERLSEVFEPTECAAGLHTFMLVRTMPHQETPTRAWNPRTDPRLTVESDGDWLWTVRWLVEARVLQSSATNHVSQPFHLELGEGLGKVPFNLCVSSADLQNFKKSQGQGQVLLKCLERFSGGVANFDLTILVSKPGSSKHHHAGLVGPTRHNFGANASARLPKRQTLNFLQAVDRSIGMFEVFVEITRP